jgi:hypothetical protein
VIQAMTVTTQQSKTNRESSNDSSKAAIEKNRESSNDSSKETIEHEP